MNRIIILIFLPFTILSQEKIETFEILKKEYSVNATEPGDKGYTLYLEGYALDKTVSNGGLMIESKKIEDFKNAWEEAKLKYIEWTAVAKENKVTDMRKDIKIKIPKLDGFFNYGGWHFDFNVSPYFKFIISEGKPDPFYCLGMYTGKLNASDNQYISSETFFYGFYSIEDIEHFINLLDPKIVVDHFEAKKSKKDLFED